MHIHRSRHACGFTVLPNTLLQDRRLTYTARGLLADLLSRPNGWREDGRHMADTSSQGRMAVSKALRELAAYGYYRVDKIRQQDGTFRSEAHVFDTPQQPTPDLTPPEPGRAAADRCGSNPVKNHQKEPPALPAATQADPGVREAVAALFRAIRPEPRLRLGSVEAAELAPLVTAWLERGCSERDLTQALLPGLPVHVHSAAALLRDRLIRKLPPAPEQSAPRVARWSECGHCGDPVPHAGICRTCAGLGSLTPTDRSSKAAVTARGIARVRAALRPIGNQLQPDTA